MKILVSEIKPNPENPRNIKGDKFDKLVKSIKDFPEMLDIRPIVVNKDMVVLGGNMRLKAIKKLGIKEIEVIIADKITEAQEKEFVIKDNLPFGEWDKDMLADWNMDDLANWGLEMDFGADAEEKIQPEVEFTEELMEENNYVVVKFKNSMDFTNFESNFGIQRVKALDSKTGYTKIGVGRVIDWDVFINNFKKTYENSSSD